MKYPDLPTLRTDDDEIAVDGPLRFVVYHLLEDGEPFYVGYGTALRPQTHLKFAASGRPIKDPSNVSPPQVISYIRAAKGLITSSSLDQI
jgi:hypothetical protein